MFKIWVFSFLFSWAVHTSGAIRPATTNDNQLKCGSVFCQAVSEVYSKSKLNYGYNYVATIPAGAMNLTIKQMSRTDNLLVLKTEDDVYIINGNNRPSEGGIFEYNHDTFDYNREESTIQSQGPLNRPVVLSVFVRGLNTGIKYDYIIPVPSASLSEEEESQSQWNELGQPVDYVEENNLETNTQSSHMKERRRRKFSWKLLGFGQCNRSCGPGIQPPIFRCIRDSPTRYFSPKRCANVEKPTFSEDIYHCSRGLCPAYWRAGDYGDCRCNDGDVTGLRLRLTNCVQEQITSEIKEVAESLCEQQAPRPEFEEVCDCPKLLRRKIYARAPDKAPKIYARLLNGASMSVRRIRNASLPARPLMRDERLDKTGVWLMSDWTQNCAEDCAISHEHRSIYCDRTAPFTDLCDLRYTPEQNRRCMKNSRLKDCRGGTWFTSAWSNCTGDCFKLERRRLVFCLQEGLVVQDELCSILQKPKEVRNCSHEEVNFCGPKWHYSEWSECSRSCGEGVQRRHAKCLSYDWKQNVLIESNNCKYLLREPVYGSCNTQKCEEEPANNAAAVGFDQFDRKDCSDEISNCKRINRNRLCKMHYYKTYCCATCRAY